MIKKVNDGEDLQFRIQLLDNDDKLLNYNLFDKYLLTAFTSDENDGIVYDRSDMNDFILSMSWKDISKLDKGQLKFKYMIEIIDDSYEDGSYTKIGYIQTRYFIDKKNNGCNCGCRKG